MTESQLQFTITPSELIAPWETNDSTRRVEIICIYTLIGRYLIKIFNKYTCTCQLNIGTVYIKNKYQYLCYLIPNLYSFL